MPHPFFGPPFHGAFLRGLRNLHRHPSVLLRQHPQNSWELSCPESTDENIAFDTSIHRQRICDTHELELSLQTRCLDLLLCGIPTDDGLYLASLPPFANVTRPPPVCSYNLHTRQTRLQPTYSTCRGLWLRPICGPWPPFPLH